MTELLDTSAARMKYLMRKYTLHPTMLIVTLLTICMTALTVLYLPQNMVVEDTLILLWIILFFFYSDKIIFVRMSNARYERLKAHLCYLLNENHLFIWCIFSLILFSVGLITVEMVIPMSPRAQEIVRIIDFIILGIFLLEFYLRFIAAGEDKIRHLTKGETIIDLMALFPLLRIFRLMRFIRLLRFLRIAKFRRYLQALSDSVAVFAALWSENVFNIVIILVLVFVFLIFGTITIFHLEHHQQKVVRDIPDALWWSISLLFAGQPLDSIEHGASRAIGFILLMSGVIITSILTGTIAATLSERLHSVKTGSTHFYFRDHIVICGWRPEASEMIGYLHQHMGRRRRHIVVIDDAIDELPPLGKDVYFIKGNPASESVLVRANAHHAGAAIILSGDGIYGDQKTILATLAVESLSRKKSGRDIHTCSELVNPSNAKNLARAYVNEMILVDEYSSDIIAQSALIPGLIDFMNELLSNANGENNIYKIISDPFVGKSFSEIYLALLDKNIIPIGILREERMADAGVTQQMEGVVIPEIKYRTLINPKQDEIIGISDKIFVVSRQEDIKGLEVARE